MDIKSTLIELHIIRIREGKIEFLLLKRSADQMYPNLWQMVTGKTKSNETAYEASLRELKEETGLSPQKMFVVPYVNSFYNEIDNSINSVPVFVCIVNENSNVILSDEHQSFEWVRKKKCKKMLAWPGQAKSVNIIHDFFSKKYDNLNFIETKVK